MHNEQDGPNPYYLALRERHLHIEALLAAESIAAAELRHRVAVLEKAIAEIADQLASGNGISTRSHVPAPSHRSRQDNSVRDDGSKDFRSSVVDVLRAGGEMKGLAIAHRLQTKYNSHFRTKIGKLYRTGAIDRDANNFYFLPSCDSVTERAVAPSTNGAAHCRLSIDGERERRIAEHGERVSRELGVARQG